MNEFELIKKYIRTYQANDIVQAVGDDCSVVDVGGEELLLQCTDCLVENVHFRTSTHSFSDMASKSLAVNISDIAAMGGKPLWAHLSLALTPHMHEKQVEQFLRSFQNACEEFQISLIGGDLSRSESSFFINVHLTGRVPRDQVLYRRGLSETSVLCVSGALGDSAAGLFCLENNIELPVLVNRHLRPPIELKKAQWLAASGLVLGMMDLSDGLASDLHHIVGAKVDIELQYLPLSQELVEFCHKQNKDPLPLAVAGGEDYRLLFNCRHEDFQSLLKSYQKQFGESFYKIGEVTKAGQGVHYFKNGTPYADSWNAFSHFS